MPSKRNALTMFTLIIAGEAIFFLPFVLPRVFRPTLLEVFQITNLELGLAFSFYGIVAMASYFFGGPLADRLAPRFLMTLAMFSTSIGGIFMFFVPDESGLRWLYGFWGLTSIFLFWAAMIKATREWGGHNFQGRAFGILDAGRGLWGAIAGSASVFVLAWFLPDNASLTELKNAFQYVILFFSVMTLLVSGLIWLTLKNENKGARLEHVSISMVIKVIRMPTIWLQAGILVCAYVGYKATDDFSLYAKEVLGYDDVASANVGTFSLWVRPIGALLAGFVADKFTISKITQWCFLLLTLGALMIGTGLVSLHIYFMLGMTIVSAGIGVYGLRGLYYAIMQEGKVPLALTGTAVGVVSVIGYTPDIFFGPLMGFVLDTYPGPTGHQYLFLIMAGFGLLGIVLSWLFRKVSP
ncbi:MAG: MFS transporter [Cyclobacteriaceae bacterium]